MAAKIKSPNKGQALVEFIPALVLFLIVISAGLAYFRVMRAGVIRQEAVRNLAFAKIANSGTLTTTSMQVDQAIVVSEIAAVTSQNNLDIGSSEPCFKVSPNEFVKEVNVGGVYGLKDLLPVKILTYAVIYRDALKGSCQ